MDKSQAVPGSVQSEESFCDKGHSVTGVKLRGQCDKGQTPTVAEAQQAGPACSFSNIQLSFPMDRQRFNPSLQPRPRICAPYSDFRLQIDQWKYENHLFQEYNMPAPQKPAPLITPSLKKTNHYPDF